MKLLNVKEYINLKKQIKELETELNKIEEAVKLEVEEHFKETGKILAYNGFTIKTESYNTVKYDDETKQAIKDLQTQAQVNGNATTVQGIKLVVRAMKKEDNGE